MWGDDTNSNVLKNNIFLKNSKSPKSNQDLKNTDLNVSNKHKFKDISIARYHTVFLSASGHVYVQGTATSKLGTTEVAVNPVKLSIKKESKSSNKSPQISPPKIQSNQKPGLDVKFSKISSSHCHTLLLTSNFDKIYGFGCNRFNQLQKTSGKTIHNYPAPIHLSSIRFDCKITDIAVSRFHSMILLENGEVYTYGLNGGQLGHNKNCGVIISEPKLVDRLMDISVSSIKASPGASLVFGVDEDTGHDVIYVFTMYQVIKLKGLTQDTHIQDASISGGYLDRTQKAKDLPAWYEEANNRSIGEFGTFSSQEVLPHENSNTLLDVSCPLRCVITTEKHGLYYWEQVTSDNFSTSLSPIQLNSSGYNIKPGQISSIQMNLGNGFIFSQIVDGTVFLAKIQGWKKYGQRKKNGKNLEENWSVSSSSKSKSGSSNNVSKMTVSVKRVQGYFRAEKVACSHSGKIFGVIQFDAKSRAHNLLEKEKKVKQDEFGEFGKKFQSFQKSSLLNLHTSHMVNIQLGDGFPNFTSKLFFNSKNFVSKTQTSTPEVSSFSFTSSYSIPDPNPTIKIPSNIPEISCDFLLTQAMNLIHNGNCEILNHGFAIPEHVFSDYKNSKFDKNENFTVSDQSNLPELESSQNVYQDFIRLVITLQKAMGFTCFMSIQSTDVIIIFRIQK